MSWPATAWTHRPVYSQSPDAFRADIAPHQAMLEDTGGVAVIGYRAASFSIGASKPLGVRRAGRGGLPLQLQHLSRPPRPLWHARRAALCRSGRARASCSEVPMSTVRAVRAQPALRRRRLFPPAALCPVAVGLPPGERARQAAGHLLLPPLGDRPRPAAPAARRRSRAAFRHYLNLQRMEDRLGRLLRDFAWGRMDGVFGARSACSIAR